MMLDFSESPVVELGPSITRQALTFEELFQKANILDKSFNSVKDTPFTTELIESLSLFTTWTIGATKYCLTLAKCIKKPNDRTLSQLKWKRDCDSFNLICSLSQIRSFVDLNQFSVFSLLHSPRTDRNLSINNHITLKNCRGFDLKMSWIPNCFIGDTALGQFSIFLFFPDLAEVVTEKATNFSPGSRRLLKDQKWNNLSHALRGSKSHWFYRSRVTDEEWKVFYDQVLVQAMMKVLEPHHYKNSFKSVSMHQRSGVQQKLAFKRQRLTGSAFVKIMEEAQILINQDRDLKKKFGTVNIHLEAKGFKEHCAINEGECLVSKLFEVAPFLKKDLFDNEDDSRLKQIHIDCAMTLEVRRGRGIFPDLKTVDEKCRSDGWVDRQRQSLNGLADIGGIRTKAGARITDKVFRQIYSPTLTAVFPRHSTSASASNFKGADLDDGTDIFFDAIDAMDDGLKKLRACTFTPRLEDRVRGDAFVRELSFYNNKEQNWKNNPNFLVEKCYAIHPKDIMRFMRIRRNAFYLLFKYFESGNEPENREWPLFVHLCAVEIKQAIHSLNQQDTKYLIDVFGLNAESHVRSISMGSLDFENKKIRWPSSKPDLNRLEEAVVTTTGGTVLERNESVSEDSDRDDEVQFDNSWLGKQIKRAIMKNGKAARVAKKKHKMYGTRRNSNLFSIATASPIQVFLKFTEIIWTASKNKLESYRPANSTTAMIDMTKTSFLLSDLTAYCGSDCFADQYIPRNQKSWWEWFELFFPKKGSTSDITSQYFKRFYNSYYLWISESHRKVLWILFKESDYMPASFVTGRLTLWGEKNQKYGGKKLVIQRKDTRKLGEIPGIFL
jgi:hypothetical protein